MSKARKDSTPDDATKPAPLYGANDPIPVPDVSEVDSESIWALFPGSGSGAKSEQDADPFGETAAAPLKP